jgi:hypothetical protein
MIEALSSPFVQAWLLGLIALVVGRYVGGQRKELPLLFGPKLVLYLKVWVVTFLAQSTFAYLGHVLALQEHVQSGFAEFLLPIAVGSYYAHAALLRLTSKP